MKKCTIEGCDRKHQAKGFCKSHYSKYLPAFNKSTCSIDKCENIVGITPRGLCAKHYSRWKRTGDPLGTTRLRNYFSISQFVKTGSKEEIFSHVFENNAQWSYAAKLYYGDKCSICDWNEVTCDVNHITPKKEGGTNTIANAEVLCPNCHAKKHRRPSLHKRKWITRE